jgi:hypothetical protein
LGIRKWKIVCSVTVENPSSLPLSGCGKSSLSLESWLWCQWKIWEVFISLKREGTGGNLATNHCKTSSDYPLLSWEVCIVLFCYYGGGGGGGEHLEFFPITNFTAFASRHSLGNTKSTLVSLSFIHRGLNILYRLLDQDSYRHI